MIDVIDSLIQTIKDPFGIAPDYLKVFWHEIPDSQKMLKPATGYRQSATGYGSKIPTDRMLQYRGRWRRVYYMVHSNAGTCYFISRGEEVIVS